MASRLSRRLACFIAETGSARAATGLVRASAAHVKASELRAWLAEAGAAQRAAQHSRPPSQPLLLQGRRLAQSNVAGVEGTLREHQGPPGVAITA